MTDNENMLLTKKHYLILIPEQIILNKIYKFNELTDKDIKKLENEIDYLEKNFCGNVINSLEQIKEINSDYSTNIFILGDIELYINIIKNNKIQNKNIFIIKELSWGNFDIYLNNNKNIQLINSGCVPINIHNIGIYFRNCFDSQINWFKLIGEEHKFQSLTESNKESSAFRTGIYLTPVELLDTNNHNDNNNNDNINNDDDNNNKVKFNLMRSSTNFKGPTENFTLTDNQIVSTVNQLGLDYFLHQFTLNHVQAQIYHNMEANFETGEGHIGTKSERKARIKPHTDKTQDMDPFGIMVFCSFYENYIGNNFTDRIDKKITCSNYDLFDFTYGKNVSVLTRLRFKLKLDVNSSLSPDNNMVKSFDLLLYPNSVFAISLETNRLYTHEIVPSNLFVNRIPTRMGYVIRCSKTRAIWKDNKTWLIKDNMENKDVENKDVENKDMENKDNITLIELEKPDENKINMLKDIYFEENITSKKIIYPDFNFSINDGDYLKPII